MTTTQTTNKRQVPHKSPREAVGEELQERLSERMADYEAKLNSLNSKGEDTAEIEACMDLLDQVRGDIAEIAVRGSATNEPAISANVQVYSFASAPAFELLSKTRASTEQGAKNLCARSISSGSDESRVIIVKAPADMLNPAEGFYAALVK